MHFAGSIVVPESVEKPLDYYANNTLASHALISAAVAAGVPHILFSSTAAVYGAPERVPIEEDDPKQPINPYGASKLMTERMLARCRRGSSVQLWRAALFQRRRRRPRQAATGQIGKGSTHLIKVAVEAAVGKRDHVAVFGTDYPTPDGTCVRDYVHVSDLAAAHVAALERLIDRPDENLVLNCGYGDGPVGARGARRASTGPTGRRSSGGWKRAGRAIRRAGGRRTRGCSKRSTGSRRLRTSTRSSATRWRGSAGCWNMPADHILAIDQGTTSTRAILFDSDGRPVATAQQELTQHYPRPGWVEHDPEEIWQGRARDRSRSDRQASGIDPSRIAGIGITNQRETAVVWDRSTGEPIHPAIVWQDRRTAELCARLKADGAEPMVAATTGLLLDPYFSATKIAWMLDHVPGARARAERGELAFGTIDSFLLWRLTGGAVHATDITNASRTCSTTSASSAGTPSCAACSMFRNPCFPTSTTTAASSGRQRPACSTSSCRSPGMAGDQQAALFGQGCFEAGMAKSTYGTGCFMLLNTGETAVQSDHRLLTTPAYPAGGQDRPMRSKVRSSSPGRRSNGCATGSE